MSTAIRHLRVLASDIGERCVGSSGNLEATGYVRDELTAYGWDVECQRFEAFDWYEEGATLKVGSASFRVSVSPWSLSCDATGPLLTVGSLEQLLQVDARDKLLLIHGELTREPLMPKRFPFYNPESHKRLVSALEDSGASALICVVDEDADHAGGEYPFAVIEDGDFPLPSVYMSAREAAGIHGQEGVQTQLVISAHRNPSHGYNVIGKNSQAKSGGIFVTAHVDSKKGTPGAIDNATGVVTILLLAEMMEEYRGRVPVELVVLNGEDYYSTPGHLAYLQRNQQELVSKRLNINIDGVGLNRGATALSSYNLPSALQIPVDRLLRQHEGIVEGRPWVQGDHSIFLQYGVPAIALSSQWLIDNLDTQDITHTSRDRFEIVDAGRLVQLARALAHFITKLG